MKEIISRMNREIIGFIKHLDIDPDAERPTTFWFYSDAEENIYHLASHLQKTGLKIDYCGPAAGINQQLLIAEKWMKPTEETMNNLWTHYNTLANQYNVEYDGWETRIDL